MFSEQPTALEKQKARFEQDGAAAYTAGATLKFKGGHWQRYILKVLLYRYAVLISKSANSVLVASVVFILHIV